MPSESTFGKGRGLSDFDNKVIFFAFIEISPTFVLNETPDKRPGFSILMFSMSGKELAKQIEKRVGQCVLTCPTTSVFNGFDSGEKINLSKNLRFFGDGWQISKVINNKRFWRIPTMDGEFVGEETVNIQKCVGGGNLLILAKDQL